AMKRQAWRFAQLEAEAAARPKLTPAVLTAYVERKQRLQNFSFEIEARPAALTEDMLLGYIAKRRNQALEAIESVDVTTKPALTAAVLSAYAAESFQPTHKKVKLADEEKLCLTQAI